MWARIGIDYSLNSPAICVCQGQDGEEPSVESAVFFAFGSKKIHEQFQHPQISLFLKGTTPKDPYPRRYAENITLLTHAIRDVFDGQQKTININIEGYSYASTSSSMTQIAENGGVLRYLLWKEGLDYTEVAPTTVKKHASGKGNSDKVAMYAAWLENGGLDLKALLSGTAESNPISDLVDAYFIMRVGV